MSRRSVAVLAAAVLATGGLLAVAPPAQAHGAPTSPGSRTYLCYVDGHWTGGDLEPRNGACRAAIAKGGKQPLWDWFGVLRADGAGRTRGFIPDGRLCGAGTDKYAAYDLARADWPATHLTAGARFTYRHNAWAPHPGEFRLYVTKDGYDPTRRLRWDDLEAEPFSTYRQTTPNGNGEYRWKVTLPAGKTGRHVIYTVWERSDSKETFYGCSDVVFDGGSGRVSGFPQSGEDPTEGAGRIPPVAEPEPAATTEPARKAAKKAAARTPDATPSPSGGATDDATGGPPAAAAPTSAGSGGDGATCTARLEVQTWPGGHLVTVAVLNTGAARRAWQVGVTVPKGTAVPAGWNARVGVSGTTVTAAARPENAALDAGEQVSVGFVATGPAPLDATVSLDGTPCAGAGG